MPLLPHPRWLLLSDIHFRPRDLERIKRTAEWIVSLARQTPSLSRVVICGDVLTSRSMQPTAVISAAYRFLSDLSTSVPHVNVILGNHDLAYRRDYSTTALEALNMSRLRPFVSLHDEVGRSNWDGRDVLILPFREDQTELTAAVANLDPDEAAHTIAFAHLAINRAVTQRHVIRNNSGDVGQSIRYKGLTGPGHFSSLARTFTGHFHSHQVILQSNQTVSQSKSEDRLQGSIAYLGAPLQLTWADLLDEDRGVVLLDPATLEYKLIVNPHAVGYITIQDAEVLDENIDASTVQGKHVMLLGELTRFRYWTARDKLLSLGAQSVREPRSMPTFRDGSSVFTYQGLGTSIPASDRGVALASAEPSDLPEETSRSTTDEPNPPLELDNLRSVKIDPVECVPDYVQSLGIEPMHEKKTIELGQRLIIASEYMTSLGDDPAYKVLLDPSYSIATSNGFRTPTKQVFVARPRSIVICNFLGVQDECTIDFDGDLGRGLTFVVGSNGSGKSTLIEAIVWCQFGRCIRKGMSVGDVVNDITGRDCMVSLSFSNGYTITRFRKHKTHGNRVIVSLNGIEQTQFEHGEARSGQAALDELLGIDYEDFIKAVVLGHESAASFLSSTPAQRHDLIESSLGLSTLDKSADLSRRMVREVDDDTTALRSKVDAIKQTISLIGDRISNREKELRRLRIEENKAREAVSLIQIESGQSHIDTSAIKGDQHQPNAFEEDPKVLSTRLEELRPKIKESKQAVDQARSALREVETWERAIARQSASDQSIHTKGQRQAVQDEPLRVSPRQPDPVKAEQIQSFESTLQHLAQAISWLELHALNATDFLSLDSPGNRTALHFIRIGLMSMKRFSSHLNGLLDQFKSSIPKQQQEYKDAAESIAEQIETKLTEGESNMIKPIKESDDDHTRVALDKVLNDQTAHSLSNNVPKIDSHEARQRLSFSLGHLSELLEEQAVLHDLQAKHQRELIKINERARKREVVLNNLAEKEREVAIYEKLIEEETSMLGEQRSSHASITAEMESLMSTRELFAFWEESLSRRRTKSAKASTFRNYVLDKNIQELNTAASNILLVLYENTRHAQELTKSMLRTIIAADAENDQDSGSPQNAGLLDQTLGVSKTLSYAKRSGGERKRIDLAVFFALVQILQAHSRHRARYILIDEAFDSLDAAGQAAVVKWRSQLMTQTDFQLIVTHSDFLISSARGASNEEDSDELQGQFSVLHDYLALISHLGGPLGPQCPGNKAQ
ncbi:P-loop containing nucleoside triphosphate hydrolase protein [Xylaria sp. FL1777]|nr:P-loop containing nucleoside triphosphate hydrolase protein [Xylaria sp. FL1777]